MFIVSRFLVIALQRSAMWFEQLNPHSAPTERGKLMVRGYRHAAPPEQRILERTCCCGAKDLRATDMLLLRSKES